MILSIIGAFTIGFFIGHMIVKLIWKGISMFKEELREVQENETI